MSAVFLAKELAADLVLLDERKARRFAQQEGLTVAGCIGILEDLFERGRIKRPAGGLPRIDPPQGTCRSSDASE